MEIFALKKRKYFVEAAKGCKVVTNGLVLQAAFCSPKQNPTDNCCFVGFTATKRLGKAHIRNRTKRRLRAVIREIYSQYALPNIDYVLVGRFDTYICPFTELRSDVIRAFKKANKTINADYSENENVSALAD